MQVSVEELGGLERRLVVQVPSAKVEQEIESRLQSLSRKVKLDGFRPGKVPLKVVKRMYGPQVRQEVLGDMVEKSFQEAVSERKLRPASGPRIEPRQVVEGQDLEYVATFEVVPEIEVGGFESIAVERPAASVTDADVDAMLETLRKQRTNWVPVERSAQSGDRVTITFEGKIDGADFPGNKGDDVPVIIGAGGMLKDFEDGVLGMTTGETKTLDVTFPADYHAAEVAGKVAQFTVRASAVAEPNLPTVDEEFAKAFGVEDGGVDALRQALKENMERELAQGIKAAVKRQVMEGLLSANPIDLPKVLVSEEIDRLAQQAGFPAASGEAEEAAKIKSSIFETEARRRVALGLLISRLVSAHDIKLDSARVLDHVRAMAATYQEPDEVAQWYLKNPQALEGVRALALEDTVVEWLLERAQVTEQPSSFDAVMRPGRPPASV